MKQKLTFLLFNLMVICMTVTTSFAVNSPAIGNASVDANTLIEQKVSAKDLVTLKNKDIEKKLGRKLKLKEKIAFALVKRKIKKAVKKGKKLEDLNAAKMASDSDFNVGAFFLGFLLGLIGILLAYIFMRDNVKSAWIGLGVWVGILLIALLL